MNAVRIRKRVESETLHLPELKGMIGKDVEIIVLEEAPNGRPRPDVNRLRNLAEHIGFDEAAFENLRKISTR